MQRWVAISAASLAVTAAVLWLGRSLGHKSPDADAPLVVRMLDPARTAQIGSRSPQPITIHAVVFNGRRGVYGCDRRPEMNNRKPRGADDFGFTSRTLKQFGDAWIAYPALICGGEVVKVDVETDRGSYRFFPRTD